MENIHSTVLATFPESTDGSHLYTIGQWYFKFLSSEEDKVTLTFPYYNKKLVEKSFLYCKTFLLALRLAQQSEIKNFEGLSLFDINKYRKNPRLQVQDYILDYLKEDHSSILWQNNTLTSKNRFLPVFKRCQLISKNLLRDIDESFHLFSAISQSQLITFPVFIDLTTSFLTLRNNNEEIRSMVRFLDVDILTSDNPSDIATQAKLLRSLSYSDQIILRYPYHRNIHTWLIQSHSKTIELNFNTRFYFDPTLNKRKEVIFLPLELRKRSRFPIVHPIKYFQIYSTGHDKVMFDLFLDLKDEWDQCGLNKFLEPFPKYWLMFVNRGKNVEEWKNLFSKTYPSANRLPIINKVYHLIEELWHLDWISNYLKNASESINFVFPEMVGHKEKRLELAYNFFQNYVRSMDSSTTFSTEVVHDRNNQVLNGFDLISTVNILQETCGENFLLPDFMFFSYRPWLLFYIYLFQKEALVNDTRERLDLFEKKHIERSLEELKEVSAFTKVELKKYHSKFSIPEEDLSDYEESLPEEDFDMNDDEDNYQPRNISLDTKISDKILITTREKSVELHPSDKIYTYNLSLKEISAEELKPGDLFFTVKDSSELVKKESFLSKWTDIPEEVKLYQSLLYENNDAYYDLNRMGLNYAGGEKYFKTNYCLQRHEISENKFILPRKRKYWKIICEFLGIDSHTMNMAFVAYYGRTKSENIKTLIKDIFKLMIERNLFDQLHTPETIVEISKIVKKYEFIFEKVEDFNLDEITESILKSISKELTTVVQEVVSIKIISNE